MDNDEPIDDKLTPEWLNAASIFYEERLNAINSTSNLVEEKLERIKEVKDFSVSFSVLIGDGKSMDTEQVGIVTNKIHPLLSKIILSIQDLIEDLGNNIQIESKIRDDYINQIKGYLRLLMEIAERIQSFFPSAD